MPKIDTPLNQDLHRLSVEATPLQSSRPSPSTSKVDEVTSFGDVNLDEVILFPKVDLLKINVEHVRILQDALIKNKHRELLQRKLR